MFQSTTIKVDKWTTENVVSWIKGLDDAVSVYHSNFAEHLVTGRRLVILDYQDLENIGVIKVGHQEAILEHLELLLSINNDINKCNLQSLALKVTCRIGHVHRILEQQDADSDHDYNRKLINSVCFLVQSLKHMINWLSSPPFTTMDEFITLHQHISRAILSVISVFSKSSKIQSLALNKSHILNKLAEIEGKCDDLIKNCGDPMILTPASLENVIVRKRADEPLGLHVQSTQQGIHTIKLIRANTACENVTKLEPGDQIIQVNHQVVVGWQLGNVVKALKEKPKEVSLTVRKSPRHFNLQAFNQRRPSPKNVLTVGDNHNLKQSTLPKVLTVGDNHNLKQSTLPKRVSKHGSEEGSFDGKTKSCFIGETPATIHITIDAPTASTLDNVFSPTSPADSDAQLPVGSEVKLRRPGGGAGGGGGGAGGGASGSRKPNRPTILVNDMWDPQHSGGDMVSPGTSGASNCLPSGKKDILSSYHVIKSTPELRTPEAEQKHHDFSLATPHS